MKHTTNTHYEWPSGSAVAQVDVRSQTNGQSVAYLYADPTTSKDTLLAIRAALRQKGWGTLSDNRDGKFALRVSGIRHEGELLEVLQGGGFVGAPQVKTHSPDDSVETPATLGGKIRNNSLKYSGILATVGNALATASGLHRGKVSGKQNWGQTGKGLAFAVADLPLAIAGSNDDARQLGDFLRQLKKHYVKENIEIPQTASIHVETSNHGKGLGELSMDYMHRYANQIKCSMEGVAAGMSMAAGKQQKSWPKRYAPFLWGPGFISSLLIPEKKIDPEKYANAGTLQRAWMKIQSNPLAIGGVLGYTNTAADFYSARLEYKKWNAEGRQGPPMYLWDTVTPSVMIGANGLYAISKKTVGGDIKSSAMVSDAYTIAAQIINKQPEATREQAIESTARFFADRTEIKEHYPEVMARLRKEIETQRQNPWFENITLPTRATRKTEPALGQAVDANAAPSTTIKRADMQHVSQGITNHTAEAAAGQLC